MKTALTIQERIKDLRTKRGLTLEQLAEQTRLSKSALGSYEVDEGKDISHFSIVTLAKYYGVSTDYLLGLVENDEQQNAELSQLHLNDEMIALLKNGKINARLLCEMASHKDFVKLLADIEIYVDGIAAMQLQNLNAYVNVQRMEIEKRYHPGEDDPHMRILKAAHINEDDYFANIVHADMDSIIRDIKNAHRGDSESAPESDVMQELNQDLAYFANTKGPIIKKVFALFTRRLKINRAKLSNEESDAMEKVLQKSELMKSAGSQRGKAKNLDNEL